MSALPPKADMFSVKIDVCFVPCVDGSLLARVFLRVMHGWSVLPCVRPVNAALSHGRWP
jgi:hypothetical protein